MITVVGKLPELKKRNLLRTAAATASQAVQLKAELEEGYGPHRLAEYLRGLDLPDQVTLVLRPTLAFLSADLCLIVPGLVLVINALHWRGQIGAGQKGEWTGANGRVDLGRPDRRAHLFCDRLAYSGLATGFALEPAVVFTAGPVAHRGEEPLASLVQWADMDRFLQERLPVGVDGFSAAKLIQAITPP